MPENSTHKCTDAVNNVQPIRNSSHMAKILSVYNRLQAGDYENSNGDKSIYSVYLRNASIVHAQIIKKTQCANIINGSSKSRDYVGNIV